MEITPALDRLIRRFCADWKTDPAIKEHIQEHQRRIATTAELLQPERIPHLTHDEIVAFLQDTDTWLGLRWNKQEFLERVLGIEDANLPNVCRTLGELLQRAEIGITALDFNTTLDALPGIGPAYLSEILALRFPDRYWLWNKPVRNFLKAQQIDIKTDLPWGKKGDEGEIYLAAGRHLGDLRRALSETFGKSMDFMGADLFIYWSNQQSHPVDLWAERIERWLREEFPPERLQARQEGESQARALMETKAGDFTEADLRQFLAYLSADWSKKPRQDRFMPAFYGALVNRMVETLPAFNRWTQRLWKANDAELDALLNEFWETSEVVGAGTSLPTALLYLREPENYNIWLPVMSKGLRLTTDYVPRRGRTADEYRRFNIALNAFRKRYQLVPQSLDVILWLIARKENIDKIGQDRNSFPGFTEDTFFFLQELTANNSEDWMQQDDDANKLRYRQVLREPLRELFRTVGSSVRELNPAFETEPKFGKVLAGIKKRFPDEEGAYHTHYWGAFYRQGRSKQTDAQLFVIVHPTHVNVGFSVAGSRGDDVLGRFQQNLQQAPEIFLALFRSLPQEFRINTAERHGLREKTTLSLQSSADVAQLLEAQLIDIERRYEADDPRLLEPEFADEVTDIFREVYPLYRFAITDDLAELSGLLPIDEEGEEEPEPEPRLSLAEIVERTYLSLEFLQKIDLLLRDKRQLIFYGPPGTGKTFVAQEFARYWVDAAPEAGGEVRVIQFHPSYAYEEFVEGIRPQSKETADGRSELSYPVKKGLFQRFCDEARLHPHRYYVLILDEINRGELPRIFGELLYLLEYRNETVELPYSGERFSIPANLYLLGTMNTADRSIALVDHALRRRFHFVALKPDPDIVRAYFESQGQTESFRVADLLEQLNEKLQKDGIEWHMHIGHSHFLRPDLDEVRLRLIWEHSILPTLEEYFCRQPDDMRKSYSLETLQAELGLV